MSVAHIRGCVMWGHLESNANFFSYPNATCNLDIGFQSDPRNYLTTPVTVSQRQRLCGLLCVMELPKWLAWCKLPLLMSLRDNSSSLLQAFFVSFAPLLHPIN